uniref:EGF-like domain-containing protein n=1 Tax=Plectus sambesii TaxID=2011161 RepID=A0A914VAY7_9BILA
MCDSGWTGERCETSLFNRCGDNGAERKGNCICRQNYAGDRCQYVTICIHGQLFNGRCACYYGWSGDFCDIIVCHNGIPNEEGQSCKCASKYRGKYCDFCAEPSSSPPPECAEIGKGVVNIGQDYWPMLFAALITIGIVLLESNNQSPAIRTAVTQDDRECKDIDMETLIVQADHVMRPHSGLINATVSQGFAQGGMKYGATSNRFNHIGSSGRTIWPALRITTGLAVNSGNNMAILVNFINDCVTFAASRW